MKRVLDPADLDEVTSILGETESKTFAEGRISELVEDAVSALDATGFSADDKDSLAESARLIAGTG